MKLYFANYKIAHLLAFVSAFFIHAGIAATSLFTSNPVVLNKQVIQVSFVAPSSSNSRSENSYHKKIVDEAKDKNALKNSKVSKQDKGSGKKKTLAGIETSGRVDLKSKAVSAAESEPIFDAEYLNNPAPHYPRLARKRGIQGKVFLNVTVGVDGRAKDVSISHSSGSSILDLAALDAVKQWNFIPAKRSGKTVQASVIVPLEFKII